MNFGERYKLLNERQKEAVDSIDGPVMVIAGPGTGKTELLGMRVANILQKTDTLSENILCLTFTDSGANAMRERLVSIIGADAYKIAIHTFHSFGTEIINQNGEFFYQGANFRASDELSSYQILREIFDNLEHNNPLKSKMNDEYTHLKDTMMSVSELKRSGLTSDELLAVLDINDRVIETAEPLLTSVFSKRISKSTGDELAKIVSPIRSVDGTITIPGIESLSNLLADSIESAIASAEATNSTKPITAWRNEWMKKDSANNFILKSHERQTKLRSLSYIYYQYLVRMQESELYDFDDMILRVVHAMEVFPDLKYNLQEKYQYIMVDEFQDTNLAQMRILHNLTDNPANEGKPNIMVVGDDDQAIYSFQGADVGNIHTLRESYPELKKVTLTDNYRSDKKILESARGIIKQSQDRLENTWEDIDKTLTAHHEPSIANVKLVELEHASDERKWLVESIKSDIKNGASPDSIAVLARRHHEIQALLPYLEQAGIRVNYERRDNVFDNEVVQMVQHIAKTIIALHKNRHEEANSLLPKLLSHPAFNINPSDIWKLSITAKNSKKSWLEVMELSPEFSPVHKWLVDCSAMVDHTPLERMLDIIIGRVENDDEFRCPLFEYYFSNEKLESDPSKYMIYLESLRTIRAKLREYQPDAAHLLPSFLEFIDLHQQLGSRINSIRTPSVHMENAITLMTAHKSKGLEFGSVYIVGAIDTAWGERVRSRNRLINYPENLRLSPTGDSIDERIRLFFVAATRARNNLTISYSRTNDSGKETLRASFLTNQEWQLESPEINKSPDDLINTIETEWYQSLIDPIKPSMREILQPTLDKYKLSSTHLNNFIDITRGGPQNFLLSNLLRFPQAISPSAGYGSAIHDALQHAHAHMAATKNHMPVEDALNYFERSLSTKQLEEKDFKLYLKKGTDALTRYLAEKQSSFTISQKSELDFKNQNVFVGDAHLTGSLDLVDIKDKTITITDYKTGKPALSWTGKTDYEKIKLHKYRQQLMFYNLMIKKSRDYSKYDVASGVLQFVEETSHGNITALEASFTDEELNEFEKLINAVWHHIVSLDLPDASGYDQSYKGVLAFEADLVDKTLL